MIKKLHFKIQYLFLYIKKNFIFLGLGILIGIVFYLNQDKLSILSQIKIFNYKRIGVEGLYTANNLPDEVSSLLSYGLTTITENDKSALSVLSKSSSIKDDKNYIFEINDNFFWHNGKKLTAHDINPNIKGLGLKVIDDTHIEVIPQEFFAPLLTALSKPLFLKNLIGLGPYRLNKIEYQDGYIKKMSLVPVEKDKKTLIYNFYQNEKDLVTAYKLGQVDEIRTGELPEEIAAWTNTKITQEIKSDQTYLAVFFNTNRIGPKQLRQALAYATPKTKDKNERCLGPISPTSWAYNPTVKDYNYNPAKAQELFKSNGIEKINLIISDRRLLSKADEIKTAWTDILGIEVILNIENQIDQENFDAVLAYGSIPNDPDQYIFWHSTQTGTNITKLTESRIDKLLEEGRQTMDPVERKKIYIDFQRFLLEESPAIFLSYPTIYTISRVK
ncbi:MAG: ABC transporter substrate-binding protein [Patescibacteria group bacterium]